MADNLPDISERISSLSPGQLALLDTIVDTFKQPVVVNRNPASDLVTSEFGVAFGDILKLHHSLSDDYLDKHRFEAAMVRVLSALGRNATRAAMCHPGHDVTVDAVPWSLKTQGDREIKLDTLHISKFMELGKGRWEDESDLRGLRNRFLRHMDAYERILQLRYFRRASSEPVPLPHFYELVEIPKSLLAEARRGKFSMNHASGQTPKPGYCVVNDPEGLMKFRLYFDGGTERKLQIQKLRKDFCLVHATWEF